MREELTAEQYEELLCEIYERAAAPGEDLALALSDIMRLTMEAYRGEEGSQLPTAGELNQ